MNSVIKRVLVGIVGGLVTLIGVVALVAPGPGWLIIFTGLGILATEFAWAAQALAHAKGIASRTANAARIKKEHQMIILAVGTFISLVLLVIWYEYLR
ncbi:MAG: hypothetical protein RIS93_691 [Actinomycetota bacterium]|jgi:uncharacterized protein (TIGR02611 family)